MDHDLSAERRDYRGEHIDLRTLPADPMELFDAWYTRASGSAQGADEPNALVLGTARQEAGGGWLPRSRVVLLKEYSSDGLVIYTNYRSAKGTEIAANPLVSALFWWPWESREVRFEGTAEKVSPERSGAYFAVRPRGSQLGAWASDQSHPLESIEALQRRWQDYEERFEGAEVPRPDHWGGYVIRPRAVEFWQGQPSRLHDRAQYTRDAGGWSVQRLNP